MNLTLSPRLLACADLVAPGDRVADVGCDHGYLSIHLLQRGLASAVIASDINRGPLESARRNAEKFGLEEKVRFFLTDGVQGLPQDFDTLIIAGMGGDTMVHILEAAPWLRSRQYRLVLQCQSKREVLRRYLSENGWHIARERAVRDGRFLYTALEALWQPDSPRLTPGQWYFPPALQEDPGPDGAEYYRWVKQCLGAAAAHDAEKAAALRELEALAPFIKEK